LGGDVETGLFSSLLSVVNDDYRRLTWKDFPSLKIVVGYILTYLLYRLVSKEKEHLPQNPHMSVQITCQNLTWRSKYSSRE